ncbi:MAG: hypothetical protein ACKOWG_16670, partial [Planctomycetia bacterium]
MIKHFGSPVWMQAAVTLILIFDPLSTTRAAELVLVEKGQSLAPIVVFTDAPPATRRVADELAAYIQKISGAKPQVIEGEPKP